MSTQLEKVLNIAKGEVGYQATRAPGERPSGHQKYSGQIPGLEWSNYQPWCATWVSWVAMEAGAASLYPRTASVFTAMQWFKDAGRWSEYPAIGSQVIYGTSGSTHTGLVYAYDSTYIYTYEGNTSLTNNANGNQVMSRKRARRDAYVHGYGLPKFPEGITTADPSKKGKTGFHYKATATTPVGGSSSGSTPKPAAFPGVKYFKAGANNAFVTQLGKQLVKKGYGKFYSVGPGPKWSESDRKAVQAFQRAQGWTGSDADGYPGPETWKRLFS
ncbi:peptidoglycan-binding protein [Streptomyces sp. NBC_00440]|uniref:peptidoglycan-binding protein n=1 Tax=Streptomyces sp. NBC_00440 TaxID=2975741 RepID=UPI003FCDD62D